MRRIYILLFILLFLAGCGLHQDESNGNDLLLDITDNSIDNINGLVANDNSIEYVTIYILPDSVPISIDKAHANLYKTFENLYPERIENANFLCESIQILYEKIYYLMRAYNDMETYRATFGWYFVDVYTGDVYDAGPGINELIPMR